VDTAQGKVRGTLTEGAHVFKGIPYAASTAGPNRFLAPQPVNPWVNVRDTVEFGDSAPQVAGRGSPMLLAYGYTRPVSETCLFLNVFTPLASTSVRKPVMVWLHGGGWGDGSASGPGFEAVKLATQGDVVVVTINHRLNLFGYLKLDDSDQRFADSGNAGVLDMVAALRWVRENIASFGGHPGNVTLFGQSGGASKVSALMAAPAAKGLFHKAIAQSCSGALRITEQDEAAALTHALAKQLGLASASGETFQRVPMNDLIAAMTAESRAYRPVIDDRTFTRHPFDPDASPICADIPLMTGNAATETRFSLVSDLRNFSLPDAEVRRRLARFLQIDAAEINRIMQVYAAADSKASPSDLLAQITTDYTFIRNTRRLALLQAENRAPTHVYVFSWRTPVLNGILKSPHAVEVPFVFGTAPAAVSYVGDGPDVAPLTKMMIATWSAFAHTGNPNNSSLPHWPRFDTRQRSTMMLDVSSRVELDPGSQVRSALEGLPYYEYNRPVNYART